MLAISDKVQQGEYVIIESHKDPTLGGGSHFDGTVNRVTGAAIDIIDSEGHLHCFTAYNINCIMADTAEVIWDADMK